MNKNRFQLFLLLFLILLLFSLNACTQNDISSSEASSIEAQTSTKAGETATLTISTLSYYPSDFMPLLQPIRVENCQYSVRDEFNYVIGKDFYTINYESSATMDALSEHYKKIITELDEEWSTDEYSFEGNVGPQRIMVRIFDSGSDQAQGVSVSVMFGVSPEDYSDKNIYFEDYPVDLIDFSFLSHQLDYKYTEDYVYNFASYVTSYVTTEESETVISHYRLLYSGATDYSESVDDYGITFKWKSGDYDCSVRYSNSGQTHFLSLIAQTKLH